MEIEQLWAEATAPLLDTGAGTAGKMFGAPCVKSAGKVVACLFKGRLVVKLPAGRCDALAATEGAERFDPGMGRVMREWVAVEPGRGAEWAGLVEEAHAFVTGA